MSEEKLQNLVDKYPNYKEVLEDVFQWFKNHPSQSDIRADLFYDKHAEQDVDMVFFILESENLTETVYRVLDTDGTKIGKDFNNLSEIPEIIDDVWGRTVKTKDALIMPYYLRSENLGYDI